ncbi:MAG: DUF2079 domain-containing protein, partial [Planctomycetia bacterium]
MSDETPPRSSDVGSTSGPPVWAAASEVGVSSTSSECSDEEAALSSGPEVHPTSEKEPPAAGPSRRGDPPLGCGGWVLLPVAPLFFALAATAHAALWFDVPLFQSLFPSPARWAVVAPACDFLPFLKTAAAVAVGVFLGSAVVGAFFHRSLARAAGAAAWAGAAGVVFVGYDLLVVGALSSTWAVAAGWAAGVVAVGPWATLAGLSGWLAGSWDAALPVDDRSAADGDRSWAPLALLSLVVVGFVGAFGTLAAMQWEALNVPHGDAAMYEEHLWNLLHGKGFRSQLDDGRLFLGEHLEVVHVLLLPVYLLFPTFTALTWCQAVGMGVGGWLVYALGRSRGLGTGTSACFGVAYLAYFPMQYLCLEASWKIFRP